MAAVRSTRKQTVSKKLVSIGERNQVVVKSCTIRKISCTFLKQLFFEAVQVKTHIQGLGLFFQFLIKLSKAKSSLPIWVKEISTLFATVTVLTM